MLCTFWNYEALLLNIFWVALVMVSLCSNEKETKTPLRAILTYSVCVLFLFYLYIFAYLYLFICVYVCFTGTHVWIPHVCYAHMSQKKVLDSLRLELQVVSHYLGTRTKPGSSGRIVSTLNHWVIFPALPPSVVLIGFPCWLRMLNIFFIYLLVICISSFENCLFALIFLLLIWIICFLGVLSIWVPHKF